MPDSVDALASELASIVAAVLGEHSEAPMFGDLDSRLAQLPPSESVRAITNPTVAQWLEPAVIACTGPWNDLAHLLLAASTNLPWLRSYENLEPSSKLDAFQQHYSFQLLAGPTFRGYEPALGDTSLLAGFTLQAPNVIYPAHHHEAPEIYGVISGTLDWQVGDSWRQVGPGDVIVHRPHESHAMHTGAEPALTWVAWPHSPDCHVYMPSLDPADQSMAPTTY